MYLWDVQISHFLHFLHFSYFSFFEKIVKRENGKFRRMMPQFLNTWSFFKCSSFSWISLLIHSFSIFWNVLHTQLLYTPELFLEWLLGHDNMVLTNDGFCKSSYDDTDYFWWCSDSKEDDMVFMVSLVNRCFYYLIVCIYWYQ